MEKCFRCNSTNIKQNTTYRFHDIYECLNCSNWNYNRIESCCRRPFEITVKDIRSYDLYFIRQQCYNCGGCLKMTKPLSSKLFNDKIKGEFSLDTFNSWKAKISEEKNDLYKSKRSADFRKSDYYKYLEYLSSDVWREKRKLVLYRDNNLCQNCKQRPAEDIHHLHYDNRYNELLEDLQALCRVCHAKVHNKSLINSTRAS